MNKDNDLSKIKKTSGLSGLLQKTKGLKFGLRKKVEPTPVLNPENSSQKGFRLESVSMAETHSDYSDEPAAGANSPTSITDIYRRLSREPRIGDNYNGFELIRQIAEGGCGTIWQACNNKGLQAAVKILKLNPHEMSNKNHAYQRFIREGRLLKEMPAEGVIDIFDAGESDTGNAYITMELMAGDISELIDHNKSIHYTEAVDIAYTIACTLDGLWKNKIFHRDIKPANILYNEEGYIKLADLGLAKDLNATDLNLTQAGSIVATANYSSPEQIMASEKTDFRSDIYGLGITLFELTTGTLPYSSSLSPLDMMKAHMLEPIPAASSRNCSVPAEVDAVIKRMCAKKVDDRYQSYSELISDLEKILCKNAIKPGSRSFHPEAILLRSNRPDTSIEQSFR